MTTPEISSYTEPLARALPSPGDPTLDGSAGLAATGESQPPTFRRAVLSNVTGSVISVVIGLATSTLLARLLGPGARGEYAAILNWPTVVMSAGLLGAPTATVFFVAKEPRAACSWQAHALLIAVVGTCVVGTASWALMPFLLPAQSNTVIAGARAYSIGFGVANALWLVGVSRLQGQRRFDIFNALRVAQACTWLVALGASWAFGLSSPSILALLFAGSFLVLSPAALRSGAPAERVTINSDRASRVLGYGVPAVVSTLPQLVNRRLDQLMLASFARPDVLGLYAVACTLAVPVGIITAPIANVLMPSLAGEERATDRARVLVVTTRVSVLVFAALVVVMLVASPLAILVLFGAKFTGAIRPVLILIPAAALVGLTQILEDALLGLGRPGAVTKAELAGLVAGGLVLAATLSSWPLMGAAASSVAAGAVSLLFASRAVARELKLDVNSILVPERADAERVVAAILRWMGRGRANASN